MHNNFYFLRQLSNALSERVKGFTVVSCFSQSKDELILEFNNSKSSHFIKASLLPEFCCLSSPREFNRARKNSIDLFDSIILKKVLNVRQFQNERSFVIDLEGDFHLLFKMHGNRSNVILIKANKVQDVFRNHLRADFNIDIQQLDKVILWDVLETADLQRKFFTWGNVVWSYLEAKGLNLLSHEEKLSMLKETRQQLENPQYYYLCIWNGKLILSLLPIGQVEKTWNNPLDALNDFFVQYSSRQSFFSSKTTFIKKVLEIIESGKAYIKKNETKLNDIGNNQQYQQWADLIMANMHTMRQGQETVTLPSFYTGEPITIKLKKELTPQKNAEVFYRKAKNQQIELDQLRKSIKLKATSIERFKLALKELQGCENLKALQLVSDEFCLQKITTQKTESMPFHEFEFEGFKIWIGKNAEGNDTLTLRHSYKEDLWLHAKDVAGSHVLIKYQSGKKIPKTVIERAAQLAAYNSKRKTESLCPVIVTPKKFVRKRKGDPAGMVVVEKEDVLLVEPKGWDR